MARVLGLLAAIVAAGAAVSTRAAPLESYGLLPSLEQVAISPSGRLLAIDFVKGEERTIVVQDISARKSLIGVKAGQAKIRNLQWAGDEHLIVTSSSTSGILDALGDRSEWLMAADLNIPGRKLQPLLGDVDMAGNMLSKYPVVRTVSGRPTLFLEGLRFSDDRGYSTLFRVDLDTDHAEPAVDTRANEGVDYLVGADGRPAARALYDALSKSWRLDVWTGAGWRQAEAQKAAIDTPEILGFGRDGRSILVAAKEGDDYTVRELAADGSKLGDPLPISHEASVISDPVGHQLIGSVSVNGDDRDYRFLDPNDQLQWRAITAAFKDQSVELTSWSDDRRKVVVRLTAKGEAPSYALVDLDARAAMALGSEYPGLGPGDVSSVESVRYKAADGLQLSGYLTLPNGRDPKNLPLIVFPHGGPAARDEPGFDWWAQAMASRGYAVLQVNYRGSDGFGWKFMSAGFGEWGQKMQTDLSDGVRYLAAQGTIDPARVCIVGASYGGYAALAGAALDTGVYRCAVDVAGLSDLSRFIGWATGRAGGRAGVGLERYWGRYMGASGPADPHLATISPAAHADKVSIPVLIIHGKDDTVVPFEQSQVMTDALKKAGRSVDLVVLSHEDHWLSHSDTRLQMLQATMDFLLKNNPPT
jgi:dipeptidyl aminopeptidase/acylaminoacyl peptidase